MLPVLLLASGCAPALPHPAPPPASAPRPQAAASADLDAWLAGSDESSPARSRALLRGPIAAGPVTIAAPLAEAPRPRRRSHVDVSFQKADMTNAFQFLADAGRFNLVMQEGMNGQLSATLRGIDPYDALVALAQANGVEVRYDRDVVVLKKK
jgi:hypothetical protein